MAQNRETTKRSGAKSGLQRLEVQLGAVAILAASSALAVGPDTWMEWILWGTTVLTVETARLVFFALSAALVAVLVWPWIRRPSP